MVRAESSCLQQGLGGDPPEPLLFLCWTRGKNSLAVFAYVLAGAGGNRIILLSCMLSIFQRYLTNS